MTSNAVLAGMLPKTFPEPQESALEKGSNPGRRIHLVWFWRILYVIYSIEVGIILLFLPWLNIWENNYLLFRFPNLRVIIGNAFLKGAVLGLGIVNIFIGIQEITSFRKNSSTRPPV